MGFRERDGERGPGPGDDPSAHKPDWRIWFDKKDELRDGGPDDPRIVLVQIDVQSVVYMKRTASTPPVLFEMAKGMITGESPDIGRVETLEGEQLDG